jgi:Aspartate decarboxylase
MNGAAAHLVQAGHEVIIMTFELSNQPIEPIAVLVDRANKFVQYLPLKSDLNSPSRSRSPQELTPIPPITPISSNTPTAN